MKGQGWENIFAIYVSDKRLIPRIYKAFLQPDNKTTKNPTLNKWANDLRDAFQRKI